MRDPHTLQLVMDSLRWWVTEMHVDGFRFDLASTLARSLHEVDRLSAFFDLVQQDPIISEVKLIAEPWDVGEGGYQVGNFPPLWAEWNGRFRDSVRDFWRGADCGVGELAYRLTGSSDLYEDDARRPHASINFVTAHDGFTLTDLVSYDQKHNEANGEDGNDGESHNRSWNCGVEGPTDDPAILELRARQRRNLLATTFLSQGVPMLLHGDELGRTQRGNNNAYCHDSPLSWIDWSKVDEDLLDLHARARAAAARTTPRSAAAGSSRAAPSVYRASPPPFLTSSGSIPTGTLMTDEQWHEPHARCLQAFLNGSGIGVDRRGEEIVDDHFLLLLNGHHDTVEFTLPPDRFARAWRGVLDTATGQVDDGDEGAEDRQAGSVLPLGGRSVVLLKAAANT